MEPKILTMSWKFQIERAVEISRVGAFFIVVCSVATYNFIFAFFKIRHGRGLGPARPVLNRRVHGAGGESDRVAQQFEAAVSVRSPRRSSLGEPLQPTARP